MISDRDGHIRVLPLHVANKIAAGEVVERPASVVKELVENALDAGAKKIAISIVQGGRKLVAVQDDGCGMTRDDATLSLERQATSKILDVDDIEEIDTLGFRGEAIPSIASVSRFTLTTRRRESDEGTMIQVNAGTLAEIRAAGCPPGTLVEVRDLFCNVPARRKFLRAFTTEEHHVKSVFTVHALAHPAVAFSLTVDGRELYRLAPASSAADRVRDLFGSEFGETLLPLGGTRSRASDRTRSPDGQPPQDTPPPGGARVSRPQTVTVTGFIERPALATPTRRDQYVFVNGRPATSPSIAYALREAYPRRQGDVRPAAVIFIELPPAQVDVNVHPTKREVRFRDNTAVKRAIIDAVEAALAGGASPGGARLSRPQEQDTPPAGGARFSRPQDQDPPPPGGSCLSRPQEQNTPPPDARPDRELPLPDPAPAPAASAPAPAASAPAPAVPAPQPADSAPAPAVPAPQPVAAELPLAADEAQAKPWAWFRFLATTASGYLLIETDAGVVTINPHAARERIAFEQLQTTGVSQPLLIPDTVQLSPPDFARIDAARPAIEAMGFRLEPFGRDTFKIEAIPQITDGLSPATVLSTIAHDLADAVGRRGGERWRDEIVARSVARSFAGMSLALNEDGAVRLVEDLAACRMPYVCPRGKPIMIFTSTRELNRKFSRE